MEVTDRTCKSASLVSLSSRNASTTPLIVGMSSNGKLYMHLYDTWVAFGWLRAAGPWTMA